MDSLRSIDERIADFSARPDSVLLNSLEAGPHTNYFTIPLLGMVRERFDEPPLLGSGVFVRLADQYFVLTAGHVIRALFPNPQAQLPCREAQFFAVSGLHRRIGSYLPCRVGYRYVHERSIDFGYIEIPPNTARDWQADQKAYVSARRIHVATAAALQDDDHFIISGVPDSLTRHTGERMKQIVLSYFATSLAGRRKAPPCQHPPEPGVECIDLSFDKSALTTKMEDGKHVWTPLMEDTSCVSGGACWKGNDSADPSQWAPEKMQLVGTHCGRLLGYEDGDRSFWFARQMLIGHHLRLLATDYAGTELGRFLFERWPQLRDWPEF